MSVRVVDRLPAFSSKLFVVLDEALQDGGRDILIKAKTRAPFKKGALRSNSDVKGIKPLHKRVSFWEEYARFQEFGGDGNRVVRRYTTSGTGKQYLSKSGYEVAGKMIFTIKKHTARV